MVSDNDGLHEFLMACAERLEIAASLRIGAMDSQSRVDEITAAMKAAVRDVAADLRAYA
jgi:hypothetical protein